VQAEVCSPQRCAISDRQQRDRHPVGAETQQPQAGPDGVLQFASLGRRRQAEAGERFRQAHGNIIDQAGRPDAAAGVQVDPHVPDLPPAEMPVDDTLRHVA
jgi:hypothetical protein